MYIRVFLKFFFCIFVGLTHLIYVYAYKNELQKVLSQSIKVNPCRLEFEIWVY
jgi:hypothetical protein